jgi:subtilisin family serine protease
MNFLILLLSLLLASCTTALSEAQTSKIRVMIIDTGIDGNNQSIKPFLATSNELVDLRDTHGHGTHITSIVLFGPKMNAKLCANVEIYSCKYYESANKTIPKCIEEAERLKVKLINISGGGYVYDSREHQALLRFKGTVVAAAGNDNVDLTKKPFYPASLKLRNLIAVGNGESEKSKSYTSNYGMSKLVWRQGEVIKGYLPGGKIGYMTGTSQAAAVRSHELLTEACQAFSLK